MAAVARQRHEISCRARRGGGPFFDPSQVAYPEFPQRLRNDWRNKEHPMMDIVMLALGFSFFVLAIGYTYVCERL
jgi:hypothetical protein